jgi:hypothetical protein
MSIGLKKRAEKAKANGIITNYKAIDIQRPKEKS